MRTAAEVEVVLGLAGSGVGASATARRTGLPRGTVRSWIRGQVPRTLAEAKTGRCEQCGGAEHDLANLPPSYPYLLGLYLGDGCISEHRRGVPRIRVHLDLRYPGIIKECEAALADLLPDDRVHTLTRCSNYTGLNKPSSVVVSQYSKRWPCLIPQHGRGKKHERSIALRSWQWRHVRTDPGIILRGLIHSDGCRFMNTGRNWSHPRYCFRNKSEDLLDIFEFACGLLELRCTRSPNTVYVSRKADVAVLDEHVGSKR